MSTLLILESLRRGSRFPLSLPAWLSSFPFEAARPPGVPPPRPAPPCQAGGSGALQAFGFLLPMAGCTLFCRSWCPQGSGDPSPGPLAACTLQSPLLPSGLWTS